MIITPEKKWMPAEYQDENVPVARPSPSAWLKRLDDGAHVLEAAFPDEEDCGPADRLLTAGEIVQFNWTSKILDVEFTRDRTTPIFWPHVEGAETHPP